MACYLVNLIERRFKLMKRLPLLIIVALAFIVFTSAQSVMVQRHSYQPRVIAEDRGGEVPALSVMMERGSSGGWMGVKVRELTEQEMNDIKNIDDLGVFLLEVSEESPAAKAGLKEGDILIRYAGIPILGTAQFTDLVRGTSPGRTITVEILRKGAVATLQVTVSKRKMERESPRDFYREFNLPVPEAAPRSFRFFTMPDKPRLGIYYEDLTEQLGQYFGVPEGKGVLVTSVVKDSPADKAGMVAGDVIVDIQGKKIEDSRDLMSALADVESGAALKIRIVRKGKALDITVTFPEEKEEKPTRGYSL